MSTWIALFRGINVGGKNLISMSALKVALESLGLIGVQTYIQSGNVVFESTQRAAEALRKTITDMLARQHRIDCDVLLLKPDELAKVIRSNPFRHAESQPSSLHFFFLTRPPGKIDWQAIASKQSPREAFSRIGSVLYLYAPDGIGRSKLVANLDKCLGVPTTARNFRTIEKLQSMLRERD